MKGPSLRVTPLCLRDDMGLSLGTRYSYGQVRWHVRRDRGKSRIPFAILSRGFKEEEEEEVENGRAGDTLLYY